MLRNKNKAGQILIYPAFLLFYGLSKYVSRSFYALLVGMGVHSEGYGLIAVPQLFRYAGNVSTVCYGYAGEAVAEFVRVQTLNAVTLRKSL